MSVSADAVRTRRLRLGYLAWGTACLFYSYGFFQRVTPSVMVDELMLDFSTGAAIVGTLSAFYFYAYAGLQLPIGIIADRFGPRPLLVGAAGVCAVGSVLFASAGIVEQAYLGRLLIGAGAGVSWVGCIKLANLKLPAERIAQFTGLALLAGMIGAIGGQAPFSIAVEAFGWRTPLYAAGAFALLIGLAAWITCRPDPDEPHMSADAAEQRLLDGLKVISRLKQNWYLALFGGMTAGQMLSFAGLWGVPFLMLAHDIDKAFASTMTSTLLIGMGVGGPVGGWLSDKLRLRRPVLLGASFVTLVAIAPVIWLDGLPISIAYALLFVFGAANGTMVVIFATASESNEPRYIGTASALCNTAIMGTGALMQQGIGVLLDVFWGGELTAEGARFYGIETYREAFLIYPVASVLAIWAAWSVYETHGRNPHVSRTPHAGSPPPG